MTWTMILTTVGAAALIALSWLLKLHYTVSKLRKIKDECWRGVEIQFARRLDAALAYAALTEESTANELDLLERAEAIADARDEVSRLEAERAVEDAIARSIGSLSKTNEDAYARATSELASIEDEIDLAKTTYNRMAEHFNETITSFPHSVIAGAMHCRPAPFVDE